MFVSERERPEYQVNAHFDIYEFLVFVHFLSIFSY
jgi:hypothetical protein